MIVPHTDAGNKLLTLMLYFPDKDLKEKLMKIWYYFYNLKNSIKIVILV